MHDAECENGTEFEMWSGTVKRVGCLCAVRAYARDPLPDCPLPSTIPLRDDATNRIGEREYVWEHLYDDVLSA
jgi:hypothetical protein